MPADMATTNKLLRCVNDFASLISSREKKGHGSFIPRQDQVTNKCQQDEVRRQQIKGCINATTKAYDHAHYYLKLGEPLKAILKFQDAAPTVLPMFGEPNLYLLTRLIEIGTWSTWKKFPGYEPVVFRFLESSARQKLGPRHPLVLLLGCFAQATAISNVEIREIGTLHSHVYKVDQIPMPFGLSFYSVNHPEYNYHMLHLYVSPLLLTSKSYPTIWLCVIDHIDRMADDYISRAEAQSIRIKAYFYLVRVLRNNGYHSAAIQRCQELIQLCIAIDGIRSFSANRARYNLGVNLCEAGNPNAAIAAYKEARKYRGEADFPSDGWVFAVFASSEIAQLPEQEGCIDKAGKYYEEALLGFTQCGGDGSSGALLMLKDLLEFHDRHDLMESSIRVADQYPASYALLQDGRLDDVREWVGRQVTTQASGGKLNRAWTWTSSI
ncbi:hypothetical protein E0Z10_g2172 [Xylaria hypoxylon]|uniref:Uncharacterized protein n=1 Tax=Xylaria hypoxylon TaxID=37992 RepID=A0A4Z0Z4Z0_9PEZI|nr:hypothetical protein E0Z10_g2172 [Xylaria hypoxylon]